MVFLAVEPKLTSLAFRLDELDRALAVLVTTPRSDMVLIQAGWVGLALLL